MLLKFLALRAGYSKDLTNGNNIPSDNLLGLNAGFGMAYKKPAQVYFGEANWAG